MSVLKEVVQCQIKIEMSRKNPELLIECINKLDRLPVTVEHLEETLVGKTINALRKLDGEVANVAMKLVCKWKNMVIKEAIAAEQAKKDKRCLKDTKVSNPEKLSNSEVAKDKEPTIEYGNSQLGSTAATGATSDVTKDNMQFPENSTSQPVPLNHNSSNHHLSRKDKPKEKKEIKHYKKAQASESGSSTQEDKCMIKIKKERVVTDNDSHDKKGNKSSSSSSTKHKQHNKRSHSELKTSERKHSHKERGQKRKHSSGDPEDIPKNSKSSEKAKKIKIHIADDDSIDCFSGASFAEALGMADAMKKKESSSIAASAGGSSFSGGCSSHKKNKSSTSTRKTAPPKPKLSSADAKLELLNVEVDIASTLPKISPNSRPVVAEAISLKQQRMRTKVYSEVNARGPIPSLYELCVYVLKDNIDAFEYTGGVPYELLKPILEQATPVQLLQVEFYNEYLVADTDELWEFHCRKEFRTGQRRSDETARDMYLRCMEERAVKIKALTSNNPQALANSTPVRQTKQSYVDGVAKPPRNVARQQGKFGTRTTSNSVAKPRRGTSGPKPSTSTSGASTSGSSHRTRASGSSVKPRMAPLMLKALKLARSLKRYS